MLPCIPEFSEVDIGVHASMYLKECCRYKDMSSPSHMKNDYGSTNIKTLNATK